MPHDGSVYTPFGQRVRQLMRNRGLYWLDLKDASDGKIAFGSILDQLKGERPLGATLVEDFVNAFEQLGKPLSQANIDELRRLAADEAPGESAQAA